VQRLPAWRKLVNAALQQTARSPSLTGLRRLWGVNKMASLAFVSQRSKTGFAFSSRELSLRACDIVLASLALIFFLPLMMIIAFAVLVAGGRGPVIFSHRRIGKNGNYFNCLKFRSMVQDADLKLQQLLLTCPETRMLWARDQKIRNDPRITSVGRFLRKTSLDELPQFWNVLMGEMSIVGPRPIVDSERVRYGRYFPYYAMVKPGITGLWQISGRNDVSYRRRVAMDVAYARSQSLALYLRIFVMTVPAVLLARGSS
jgi:exopolysaccharide production protein ExoY